MSAGFVAAVVEGFEGTLEEVLNRQLSTGLRTVVLALLHEISTARDAIAEIEATSCAGE